MNNSNNRRHPIQLNEIAVSKLSVVINDHDKALDYQGSVSMQMAIGKSDFSLEEKSISIGLRVKVGPVNSEDSTDFDSYGSDGGCIFLVEVELYGNFVVDLDRFQQKHIEPWSRINAPFLLFPYVREHVYGLANRAGMRGLILPLFIQPGTENFVKNIDVKE